MISLLGAKLNKIVVLYIFFDHNCKSHIVPLSVTSRILPMKMLNLKSVAFLLHGIGNHFAPPNIFNPNHNLFPRSEHIHSAYFTRSSAAGDFYIKRSRINKQLLPLSRIGVKIWNRILLALREHRKALFKRKLNDVLSQILKNEEINVDMRNIKLSKHIQPLNWLTLSSLFINIYL